MSITKLTTIDTTLTEEAIAFTGKAVPCHVGGGKLAAHVDTSGGYADETTTVTLAYLIDGDTIPSSEHCLGIDGGKAVYVKTVVTE